MSAIVVSGDTSGAVTLDAPTVAGTVTVTLPAASGTMVVTGSSPSLADVTATGNLSVSGNTTLGDASTDTVLMTGAPSIGGAGLGMGMGFRNRIINGAMVISQRGNTFTQSTDNQVGLDRWDGTGTAASKFTFAQSATAPAGFNNSTLITSLSAYSVTSGDLFLYRQRIEGYNVADLGFGTADAQTITVSFWVRSSLTGSFGGYLSNGSLNRSYLFSYTISSANTWEKKTVTIAGDTSGTWLTTNGLGIEVGFSLGAGATYSSTANTWAGTFYIQPTGATSVVGTSGATWYITGVQLEKGSTATAFDYRPYGTELALCQRYYETVNMVGNSYYNGSNGCPILIPQNTRKRAQPTVTRTNDNWDGWNVNMGNYNETSDAAGDISVWCNATGVAVGFVRWSTTILISAEL